MKKILTFLILSTAFSVANSASFDCQKASSINEKAVCSNPALSKLDDDLLAAYKLAVSSSSDPTEIKLSQRAWLKETKQCESNPSSTVSCLTNAYSSRIVVLSKIGNPTPSIPPAITQAQVSVPEKATADVTPPLEQVPSAKVEEPPVNSPPIVQQTSEIKTTNIRSDWVDNIAWVISLVLTLFFIVLPWFIKPKKATHDELDEVRSSQTKSEQSSSEDDDLDPVDIEIKSIKNDGDALYLRGLEEDAKDSGDSWKYFSAGSKINHPGCLYKMSLIYFVSDIEIDKNSDAYQLASARLKMAAKLGHPEAINKAKELNL